MTNVQAGFLYDQLKDINHILDLKKKVVENYKTLILEDSCLKSKINFLIQEKDTSHSNWMTSIFINDLDYDSLENYMSEKNIQIRPIFYDIHSHKHLENIKKSFPENMEFKRKNGVMLPSYPELTSEEQKYIINCIKEYLSIK